MIPTMPKVTPTPALFAKNPLDVAVGLAPTVDTGAKVFGTKLDVVLVPARPVIVPCW
jgi:hypothetical protein